MFNSKRFFTFICAILLIAFTIIGIKLNIEAERYDITVEKKPSAGMSVSKDYKVASNLSVPATLDVPKESLGNPKKTDSLENRIIKADEPLTKTSSTVNKTVPGKHVKITTTKQTDNKKNIVTKSRGSTRSIAYDWSEEVNEKLFPRKSVAKVTDVYTGESFMVKRTYGYNHADCEALTLYDTNIIKSIWGDFSWNRRPVIVEVKGVKIAASMAAMPHAGLDDESADIMVSDRSGDYGYGANLDSVKDNGMDGHFDIHFLNSRTHGTDKVDEEHQLAIRKAVGR